MNHIQIDRHTPGGLDDVLNPLLGKNYQTGRN